MRPLLLAFVAGALLAAAALGCGSEGDTDNVEGFSYSVSGGIAGVDRRLVVSEDTVTVSDTGADPVEVTIEPRQLIAARDALEAAPLEEIPSSAPPTGPVPDDILYSVQVGDTAVTASQITGIDPRLQPVIDAIDPVLVTALDQADLSRAGSGPSP